MDIEDYENIRPLETPSDIFDLKDRVGVIIGGAGMMGQQFALTLGLAGAKVAIVDKNKKKCVKIAEETSSRTKTLINGYECDVTQEEKIQEVFKRVCIEFGRLDFLIYNVMAKPEGYYAPFEEYPIGTWKGVLDGNLTGAFLCCREVANYLKKSSGGSIVLTSSTYGLVGPDQRIYEGCSTKRNIYGGDDPLNCPVSYSASKAGLIGLAMYLSTLWGEHKIRVNVLTPGGVYDGQEEGFHNEYVNRTPLGRMAVWSDYNGAILFLVSDASRYMTGANLVVDGGWTAW